MDPTLLAVLALIAVALIFDFINGFHDAANSIATIVSTRVLTPGQAVIWAAVFNFLAAFGFGTSEIPPSAGSAPPWIFPSAGIPVPPQPASIIAIPAILIICRMAKAKSGPRRGSTCNANNSNLKRLCPILTYRFTS